ncbi:hypothetical protein Cni_G09140 [Canna indica]|uniref:Uncharacterized protein n=1 Tax=Canna indica TaxID=4628 RepID=A0AAQ3K1Z4_9LILI|nr:hypothetical protein Cni_G09140 [Canna indica]
MVAPLARVATRRGDRARGQLAAPPSPFSPLDHRSLLGAWVQSGWLVAWSRTCLPSLLWQHLDGISRVRPPHAGSNADGFSNPSATLQLALARSEVGLPDVSLVGPDGKGFIVSLYKTPLRMLHWATRPCFGGLVLRQAQPPSLSSLDDRTVRIIGLFLESDMVARSQGIVFSPGGPKLAGVSGVPGWSCVGSSSGAGSDIEAANRDPERLVRGASEAWAWAGSRWTCPPHASSLAVQMASPAP